MKITTKQVNEIAQDLECGMSVYINRDNFEIKTILDWEDLLIDSELWEKELEIIENEWSDYVVIVKMKSREAYEVMEDFVNEVDDERLKEDLIKILNRRSPFANFKAEIESSEYREKWFEFRTKKNEEFVREQLKLENIPFE